MKKPRSKSSPDSPFRNLGELVRDSGLQLGEKPEPPPARPAAAPHHEPPQQSEEDAFAQAMDGVKRSEWKHEPVASPPPPRPEPADPEEEQRRMMEDAVNGIPANPVMDHPEYIEGWVGVAGKKFLPNLRNGIYSIQGQIDLHGLTREQARITVEDYIEQMSRFRSCCIKIIHGRGINSPNDRAVLKESLQQWLSTRRMSRHVVAFASAQFADGGVGALYVLLSPQGL
jgi:DNA-nicking Smr family endonuclease